MFFSSLLEVCKNQINSFWAAAMQKFIKYFYFSCISFFGTFSLAFPFHGNAVFLFREDTVAYYIFFYVWKQSLLSLIEMPTFALLFQNFKPYFIVTFSLEDTWKHLFAHKILQNWFAYP